MQYILNHEEYKEYLVDKDKAAEFDLAKDALSEVRDHLLKVAGYICVHEREGRYVGYCDGCPCSPIHHDNTDLWRIICGRSLAYGK